MKRTTLTEAASLSLALAVLLFAAATPAAAQEQNLEEVAAYQSWYQANAQNDMPKALKAAEDYLSKFPSGPYADYLGKWLPAARRAALNDAIKEKRTADMVRLGKEALAQDPNNLDFLYALALNLRQNELFASPPDYTHAAEAADFSLRAIKLIEAGKAPTGADPSRWEKAKTLAWLYQNAAVVEARNGDVNKAIDLYEKSTALDASNAPLRAYNLLNCGFLHKGKYDEAVKAYQAIPEEERQVAEPKPEVKAAVDLANREADAVIECWARFLAVAKANDLYSETQEKVLSAVEGLYGYRHPEDAGGLQKLIDSYKAEAKP